MKSYQNRGQSSVAQRYSHIFNPQPAISGTDMNSIFGQGIMRNSKTNLISVPNHDQGFAQQSANVKLMAKIEKLSSSVEYRDQIELMKKLANLKHKDVLRESVNEMKRCGSFVCIYPARGCDYYDRFFTQHRVLNKFLQKCLFTNDLYTSLTDPQRKQ